MTGLSAVDHELLQRCVELAREALDDGDEPFGSLLVDPDGTVRFEDRNRVQGGDHTRHPELEIARWAATHLSADERRTSTVYTSGEHCPMCSAAHAWVGLGRIVYATSTEQLTAWHREWGVPPGDVAPLPITTIAPNVEVAGPDAELAERVRSLHARRHGVEGVGNRSDSASLVVAASPSHVFAALVDPLALARWLPPPGTTATFEYFDARVGGSYRMVLTYPDSSATPGKTTPETDVVQARFVDLTPDQRIVQAVEFVSDDPAFAGTMVMTWQLTAVPEGTRVDIRADDVPAGISAEDHATGMPSSLASLASYVTA